MLTPRALTSANKPETRDDEGYTLAELLIVMAVMAVVLVIAGSALFSMQMTTTRNTAMINTEQDASTALALMARDIRSAHSISFATTTTNAANSVILFENNASGGTSPVEWLYTPPVGSAPTGTLKRLVLTSSLATQSTQLLLSDLVNTATNPLFGYYDLQGDPISTSGTGADATIQNCTTAVAVNLAISPSPVPGVATYTESNEVAITDQEQLLSAPGIGQCT